MWPGRGPRAHLLTSTLTWVSRGGATPFLLDSNPSVAYWAGYLTHLCLHVPVHLTEQVGMVLVPSSGSRVNDECWGTMTGHVSHRLEWQRRQGLGRFPEKDPDEGMSEASLPEDGSLLWGTCDTHQWGE